MAEISGVHHIKDAGFAGAGDEIGSGNQNRARRSVVNIARIERRPTVRREPIETAQPFTCGVETHTGGRTKLHHGLSEVTRPIPIPVANHVVDVAARIHRGTPAGHPDAGLEPIRRRAPDSGLLKIRGVIRHDPPVVGTRIFVRCPRDRNLAVDESKAGPLIMNLGIESECATYAGVAGAGDAALNDNGTS